jgi:hypothetical protein
MDAHAPANQLRLSLPGADRVKPDRNLEAAKPSSGKVMRTSGLFGLSHGTAVCGPACTVVVTGKAGDSLPMSIKQLSSPRSSISSAICALIALTLPESGDKKVIPNLTATYDRGAPIGVYMQIYNAGIDQTTLRPSVDVEYALLKDGREAGKQLEDWRGTSTAGDRLPWRV